MSITERELRRILSIKVDVEKFSTISDDGRNLLTRIPRDVKDFLNLKKGDKIRWLVNDNKKLKIEILKND
ncbi:MAG: hypothetical protein QXW97_00060 [Candidatus Pacearchaeota archaeon]